MTFRDEFRRYQLAQWEGVRNMLYEKQLEDLKELVGDPEDWLACQGYGHRDIPTHPATYWASWTCGCDLLLCDERAEYAEMIEAEAERNELLIHCVRCALEVRLTKLEHLKA